MSSAADKQKAEVLALVASESVREAWDAKIEDRSDLLAAGQISATLALVYATLATVK